MPILPECSNCHRKGGHAESETDKICARCKAKKNRTNESKKEVTTAQADNQK